jgi:hypothetical protein
MTNATVATSKYGAIVEQLLAFNAQARVESGRASNHWLRDFCTVRVAGARQTGMTYAIAELLTPDTIVVTTDSNLRKAIYELTVPRVLAMGDLEQRIRPVTYCPVVGMESVEVFPIITVHELKLRLRYPKPTSVTIEVNPFNPEAESYVKKILQETRDAAEDAHRSECAKYTRFIVDSATRVLIDLSYREFYNWVDLYSDCPAPEIILLG